jgi:hypothetical protein
VQRFELHCRPVRVVATREFESALALGETCLIVAQQREGLPCKFVVITHGHCDRARRCKVRDQSHRRPDCRYGAGRRLQKRQRPRILKDRRMQQEVRVPQHARDGVTRLEAMKRDGIVQTKLGRQSLNLAAEGVLADNIELGRGYAVVD